MVGFEQRGRAFPVLHNPTDSVYHAGLWYSGCLLPSPEFRSISNLGDKTSRWPVCTFGFGKHCLPSHLLSKLELSQEKVWNCFKVKIFEWCMFLHLFLWVKLLKKSWTKENRIVAISFSRGSFQPRDQTWVSHITGGFFTLWATREAPRITENCCQYTWLVSFMPGALNLILMPSSPGPLGPCCLKNVM